MKEQRQYLRGSGSGKGGQQHTPVEADDSLSSIQYGQVLDLLSEGEIEGLDTGSITGSGLQSIFLNGTPVQNSDGTNNFTGFTAAFRKGTQVQTYIPTSELGVQRPDIGITQITKTTPFTFSVTNTNVNRVRVTIQLPALRKQEEDGDIVGHSVKLNIRVKYDNGNYNSSVFAQNSDTAVNNGYWTEIKGKTSNAYRKDYIFVLNTFNTSALIEVSRVSNDDPTGGKQKFSSITQIAGATEIIDSKLRYPNSALCFLRFDSRQFSNIPTRKFLIRGVKHQLPNNAKVDISKTQRYVVATGATENITSGVGHIGRVTYSGIWDGTFGAATWSSDPAWCLYNLLTNERFGCSIPASNLQKFEFYKISQYCNFLVDDQKGGTEPRMLLNIILNNRKQIYDAVKDLTSVFRGMSFYGAGVISVFQDAPEGSQYLIGNSNVVNGFFEYTGSSQKARHTTCTVAYQDYQKLGEAEFEYVEDVDAVSKYGIINKQIKSMGCYSQGQAHRLGLWTLKTEQISTQTVSFQVATNSGIVLQPSMVISIADRGKSGYRHTGYVSSGSTNSQIKIDSVEGINTTDSGFTISILLSTGLVEKRGVNTINYQTKTVILNSGETFTEVPQAETVFLLESNNVVAQKYRVIDVKENNLVFDVLALQYNDSIYNAVDFGEPLNFPSITDLTTAPAKVSNIADDEFLYSDGQGVFVGCDISWQHDKKRVTEFVVTYRVDDDNWATLTTAATSVTLRQGGNFGALRAGNLQLQISAVNYLGKASGIVTHSAILQGKTKAPDPVLNLTMIPTNGLARLQWSQSTELDVVVGGLVRLRHSPLLAGVSWQNSNSIHEDVTGTAKEAYVDLKEGTYLAKFVDSGGRESVTAALVEFDEPNLENLLDVNTQIENPNFFGFKSKTGTNAHLTVTNGELLMAANGSVLFTTGTYYFNNNPINLGGVFSVKLKAEIKSRSFFPNAALWSTLGTDFDPAQPLTTGFITVVSVAGDAPQKTKVQLYVRTTQTDPTPSNSPTWSSWRPFNNAEFKAWGYEFKAEFETNDNEAQLAVYGLKIVSQMPQRTEQGFITSSSNNSTTVTFQNAFIGSPAIGITFSANDSGDYYKIFGNTSSQFSVGIYNSSNQLIQKTFSYIATGYGKKD